MAMPRNTTPLPGHPAVDPTRIMIRRLYTTKTLAAPVKCPICKAERWYGLSMLRMMIDKHPNFIGLCRRCYHTHPEARRFRQRRNIRNKRNPSGIRFDSGTGYIVMGKNAIPDADLDLFYALKGRSGNVLQHRWVMAKHLGRPLTSQECVDHMDGNKTNNDIGNLRLYVRGKQQPGSCPGHGTYYHEWHAALRQVGLLRAEVRQLKRQLKARRKTARSV